MLIFIIGFLLGTMLGSLSLCLADRSTTKASFWGRSNCDSCHKSLSAIDLIPVISYLIFRGKCRYCHTKISVWYPLSEIIIGLIVGVVVWQNLPNGFLVGNWISNLFVYSDLLFQIFIVVIFSIVFITDIKTGLIPDRITIPSFLIVLLYLVLSSIAKIYFLYLGLKNNEIGRFLLPPHSDYFYRHAQIMAEPLIYGLAGALILACFFGLLILITRGRGMGGGDLKLAIFIGLALALPGSVISIILSFLFGSIFGIGLILLGKKKFGQTIPFGPFMSLAGLVALLWGDQILNWYLSLRFI